MTTLAAPDTADDTSESARRSAVWQTTLIGSLDPQLQGFEALERIELDSESWLELGRDIVHGSDQLFEDLATALPWQQSERPMYDRIVKVPRLCSTVPIDDPVLPPVIGAAAVALEDRFERRFDHIGANLYRDGNDSVAWHGDTVGRFRSRPVIAILSLGGSRVFRLRPQGGGRGTAISLHSGDLLVMGGACQLNWEHAVLKVRYAQPRISLTFRHDRSDETDGPSWLVSV